MQHNIDTGTPNTVCFKYCSYTKLFCKYKLGQIVNKFQTLTSNKQELYLQLVNFILFMITIIVILK